MRLALRRGIPCQVHDLVDLLLRDRGLPATPGPTFPSFAKPSSANRARHARTVAGFFEEIIAAIELGISNALIEGINAKIRLINARGYGHHSAQTLSSMIYLCLGGFHIKLPTTT